MAAYGKAGIARLYCLIFGIAYLAVAAVEAITQHKLSGSIGIDFTALQNAIHWVIGVVTILAFFGTESTARAVARVIGAVFLALTIWGFASPTSLGNFLGFDGKIPVIYNIVHLLTAVAALFAGYASRPETAAKAEAGA